MRKAFGVVLFLVFMLTCFGIYWWWFLRNTPGSALISPVDDSSIFSTSAAPLEQDTDSSVAVSCVLSYGTYLISQHNCDLLTDKDTSQDADATAQLCELPTGSLSLSVDECEILKHAQGSKDIPPTLYK